jgi:hypothetical protein
MISNSATARSTAMTAYAGLLRSILAAESILLVMKWVIFVGVGKALQNARDAQPMANVMTKNSAPVSSFV